MVENVVINGNLYNYFSNSIQALIVKAISVYEAGNDSFYFENKNVRIDPGNGNRFLFLLEPLKEVRTTSAGIPGCIYLYPEKMLGDGDDPGNMTDLLVYTAGNYNVLEEDNDTILIDFSNGRLR